MKEIIIRFSNIRKLSAALLVIIAACASGQARASVNYMPVTEVKAGMTGYGKTVFQGLKVVKFPIKVRGIMQNAGMSGGPMILIELTGPEVDTYGGISLGMSGSPVYIKDRLIGALAVTFPETDHSLGGVTPYESMLKTADYDKPAESRILKLDEKIKIKGKTYDSIRYSSAQGDASAAPGVLTARMALAPVSVQGVSPRAFPILKRLFDSAGIDIVPAALSPGATPAAANSAPAKNIEPGSSVAVQLVRGDIDISAVGTVTAVDGKRVLMFGHPFFRKGAVNYLLADAYVHAIVRGADMPFKASSTGRLRGAVLQDRGSALLGRIGVFPKLMPVKVTVTDRDIDRVRKFSFNIVRDDDILINLIVTSVLQSFDNTIDRIGNGAAVVSFSIKCDGYDNPITRENMFYDRFDISARSMSDIVNALGLLHDNRFREADISALDINVQLDSSHSYASIEKAEIASGAEPPVSDTSPATGTLKAPKIPPEPPDDMGDAPDIEMEDTNPEPDEPPSSHDADAAIKNVGKAAGQSHTQTSDFQPKTGAGEKSIPVVRPGAKLELNVRLRPYRKDPIEEKIFLKVPDDMPDGQAIINIFSGTKSFTPLTPVDYLIDVKVEGPQQREDDLDEGGNMKEDKEEAFEDVVKTLMERDLNNELIADITSLGFGADRENKGPDKDGDEKADDRAKKRTAWVLEGTTSVKVRVSSGAGFREKPIKKSKINTIRGSE